MVIGRIRLLRIYPSHLSIRTESVFVKGSRAFRYSDISSLANAVHAGPRGFFRDVKDGM